MKSTDFLQAAIDVQAERGAEYDQAGGERSAARLATAFNAITGHILTEAEVYLLLQLLKDVRQWQNPDQYHHDSALDSVSYASLKAEALHAASEQECVPHWPTPPVAPPGFPHPTRRCDCGATPLGVHALSCALLK